MLLVAFGCAGPEGPEVCEGAGLSALTAPGRYVLGEAVPYASDPSIAAREEKLQVSQSERRALGWDVAQRALRPVAVDGLAEAHDVPLFQTFYDREDLQRVVGRISEVRGAGALGPFTEAELDDAFEWNASSVFEQEAWPADRLADYIASMDSEERVRGAGGIERITYGPLAARHLLSSHERTGLCLAEGAPEWHEAGPESSGDPLTERVELSTCGTERLGPYRVAPGGSFRADIEGDVEVTMLGAPGAACTNSACEAEGPAFIELVARPRTATPSAVVVTYDAREAPYIPCIDDGFPMGSVIFKADYRRVGFGVQLPVFDTSAETLSKLLAGDGDWGDGEAQADPGSDEIFTLEVPGGNRFRLAALHVMTKELDHWVWVTMWWSDQPDVDFGADRPAALDGTLWANYKMCAATDFAESDVDPTGGVPEPSLGQALAAVHEGVGGPSWCSNPYLERGVGNGPTNCVGCHQHAGTDLSVEEILLRANHGRDLERNNFPSDYTFAAHALADLFR
ncbi:MAG: hypothetical protein JRH11_06120 [Deltaproteobacteria bacterium]|nr:hypothetical protein [Deltaproteobacteria bacterium]